MPKRDPFDLSALLKRKEDLHPDLKRCLAPGPLGQMIAHPLVHEIFYAESMNALLNAQYLNKQGLLETLRKQNNWDSFVGLHEKPYRLEAFSEVHLALSDKHFWELLSSVWIGSENIWQGQDLWRQFLTSKRKSSQCFMNKEEQKFLAKLPEKITAYRGFIPGKNKSGLSYSLSRDTAKWFANRYEKGSVLEIKVDKKDVFSYLNGRDEEELIILK